MRARARLHRHGERSKSLLGERRKMCACVTTEPSGKKYAATRVQARAHARERANERPHACVFCEVAGPL